MRVAGGHLVKARIVVAMDEIPPPEAFEPEPARVTGADRFRRRVQVAVALIVVAALIVLAAVEGGGFIIRGDSVETPTPAAARLAVVDVAGTLKTVDGRDGGVASYAVPSTTFQFPAWSPDGSRIAAIGRGPRGTGIFVFATREADGGGGAPIDPIVVYESADRAPFYLYWTPDGQLVTFLTTEPDGLALRIAPADGSTVASVVRSGAPMYWDFVDAARLLVHSGTSGPDGFFGEVGVNGAPFEGTSRSAGVFRAPAVSGNDRFRAYLGAGDGAVGEVVRESRDGSATTRIRVFGPAAVAFSPTGDTLAFVAPDQLTGALPLPVGPLRVLDPGAAEPRTLLGARVVAFFWSPTGEEIAVLRLDNTDDNVTEAGRGGGAREVAAREVAARDASVREAAAGLALRLSFVEVSDGSLRSERVVRVSDLFVNQVLPFFDQYALSHHFWSPDGATLALPIVDDGDVTQLVAIPADGTEARVLVTAEIGFWSP